MTTTNADRLRELALLRRVRDRIDREYSQPLDVATLAADVHLSAGHLARAFKRTYGEPPHSYLMTRRIERAMALLRIGELSVTDVCFAVGCQSLGTFSTRFSELVGMSPSAYRREAVNGHADGLPACVVRRATRPTGIEKLRCRRSPMAKGSYAMLTLATDDLQGTFDRLQAGGAEVVQEPTDQPWGVRDAAFRDPAGSLLRINQA